MKISKIKLQNVKCFAEKELSLVRKDTQEPLSVCALVGANGSGKSAVLKSIVAAFTALNKQYGGELFGNDAIYGNRDYLSVQLCVNMNEQEREILQLQDEYFTLGYQHIPTWEDYTDSLYYPSQVAGDEEKSKQYIDVLTRLKVSEQAGLIMYYDPFRFVSQKNPAGPDIQDSEDPKLNALTSNIGADGKNLYRDMELKQWLVNLDYMRLKKPTERNQIIYQHIVKAFDMLMHPLCFESIDQNGSLVFLNEKDGQHITIDMLSDGFKSIFSIIVDIIKRLAAAPDYPKQEFFMKEAVVLIDEIDCHIHPKWQKKLVPSLRELFPNCQFIVTTHSPYILDSIQEYEVIKIGEKSII